MLFLIINKLKNIVLVNGEDIEVRPRQSEEGNEIVFPSITFFSYDRDMALYRKRKRDIQGTKDKENAEIEMLKPAIPYDLFYQIDFWAKSKYNINEMQRHWDGNVEKYTLLSVVDTDGTQRESRMELIDYAENDYIKNSERRFHRAYTYKIMVELDERDKYIAPLVTDPEIKHGNME